MSRLENLRRMGGLIAGLGWLAACSNGLPACGPAELNAATAEYRLGPGDRLQLKVFDQADLSGEFRLDGQGYLALPLVGEIPADHLTTRELEQSVADHLRAGDFLVHPQVSIQVASYRPFYILGEVGKPGQYEYKNGMTVVNAVALAGGYTYRARPSKITIEHGGCTFVADPDTKVLPGEVITVPERYI